jgi:hypothetical protein
MYETFGRAEKLMLKQEGKLKFELEFFCVKNEKQGKRFNCKWKGEREREREK